MLGQYGLLYALEHEDQVERLFILNTPLATKSKLRPELAAYKNPIAFLRPGNVSGGCCCLCESSAKVRQLLEYVELRCHAVLQQESFKAVAHPGSRQ